MCPKFPNDKSSVAEIIIRRSMEFSFHTHPYPEREQARHKMIIFKQI